MWFSKGTTPECPKHSGLGTTVVCPAILLMEEILHKVIGSLSHYLQGFFSSQVVSRISSINSIIEHVCFRKSYPFHSSWVIHTRNFVDFKTSPGSVVANQSVIGHFGKMIYCNWNHITKNDWINVYQWEIFIFSTGFNTVYPGIIFVNEKDVWIYFPQGIDREYKLLQRSRSIKHELQISSLLYTPFGVFTVNVET